MAISAYQEVRCTLDSEYVNAFKLAIAVMYGVGRRIDKVNKVLWLFDNPDLELLKLIDDCKLKETV